MSYETSITYGSDNLIEIKAYGGTRRSRGAKIGAYVRRLRAEGRAQTRYSLTYDEGYGFMAMTTARYRDR